MLPDFKQLHFILYLQQDRRANTITVAQRSGSSLNCVHLIACGHVNILVLKSMRLSRKLYGENLHFTAAMLMLTNIAKYEPRVLTYFPAEIFAGRS